MYNPIEVSNLSVAYWQQRVNFINQHFEILEKELVKQINSFKESKESAEKYIQRDEEIFLSYFNNSMNSIESFNSAIAQYTQKVPFTKTPQQYDKIPNYMHVMANLEHYTSKLTVLINEGFVKAKCTQEILEAFESIASSLSRVHNHMTKFTQSERELVYIEALQLMAKFIPQANVQPSTTATTTASSTPTLFTKK